MKRGVSSTAGPQRPVRAYTGRLVRWFLVLSAVGALGAYVVAASRPGPRGPNEAAVPAAVADQITVLGLPNARFWAWYDLQGAAQTCLAQDAADPRSAPAAPGRALLAVPRGPGPTLA